MRRELSTAATCAAFVLLAYAAVGLLATENTPVAATLAALSAACSLIAIALRMP